MVGVGGWDWMGGLQHQRGAIELDGRSLVDVPGEHHDRPRRGRQGPQERRRVAKTDAPVHAGPLQSEFEGNSRGQIVLGARVHAPDAKADLGKMGYAQQRRMREQGGTTWRSNPRSNLRYLGIAQAFRVGAEQGVAEGPQEETEPGELHLAPALRYVASCGNEHKPHTLKSQGEVCRGGDLRQIVRQG